MSTSDTSVPQVIVNKLTQAQYDTATKNPNEFYAITDANPGASTVTYYANSTSTKGFGPNVLDGPYIYKDAARTTLATPGEIYDNFQDGNSIHIEYESTQTGANAFSMTLEVTTMSFSGGDTYSMVVNEVSGEASTPSRDLVMLRLYTTWDGQSTFSGRWYTHRKYINDGTLTIQHNGTTKGTFTANQSTASTVNIETIYADTPGTATTPTAWVNTSEIVDGAVTNAKMSITYQYVDTGTREITVTESGTYFIFAQHTVSGPTDAKGVDIKVNGTTVSSLIIQQSSGSLWSNATPTLIMQLTAGSVVSLYYDNSIVNNSGTSAQRSHLGIIRIA